MDKALLESISKMAAAGSRLELPSDEQFTNYPLVKKCLLNAGGKYKKCGFEFTEDAQTIKDRLLGGEAINDKKKFQFFATPDALACRLVEMAEVESHHRVLEPSAGHGAIATHLKGAGGECVTVELMPQNVKALSRLGFLVLEADFLTKEKVDIGNYDRIVANPPFTKNQDIDHIKHMYKMLNKGGRLVSMASKSWVAGGQKKQIAFREWLIELDAEIEEIPSGEFKKSGTSIATMLIVIDKAA